jgi:D-arginine dehydrogenase
MSADEQAHFDVLVIGAGIAGASAAYELASGRRVALIEREEQPGYHTTGRSAALYTENYGNAVIRALTLASRPFFDRPPRGFSDHPLLTPRGTMLIAAEGQARACDAALAAAGNGKVASLSEITLDEAFRRVPALDPAYVRRALFEPAAMDMDVHAIHQGFLRGFRARGGQIALDAEVRALDRKDGVWRLATKVGRFAAPRVVNATGAWADEIAKLAGLRPIGLVPKRRTAFTFDPMLGDPPRPVDPSAWPAVIDVEETFYFKPEAGRVLASPADETPSPPCDARPEDIDIALAAERVERATKLRLRQIHRKWAGLRCFVADKTPVAGEAHDGPGFFWLAGQGGYGIMTAPAMARAIAAIVAGQDLPQDLRGTDVSVASISPHRPVIKAQYRHN